MTTYPNIVHKNDRLEINVSSYNEHPKYLEVEFVLDFNRFHDVIGIEILNLKEEAGKHCLERIENIIDSTGQGLRYSYDEDADAFYLQITGERSIDQEAVDGVLVLNDVGEVLGFKVALNG